MLPHEPNLDDELPSPELVQAQAKAHHPAGFTIDPRRSHTLTGPYHRRPPVIFEEMGLLVKWGTSTRIAETVILYTIRRLLKGHVPVQEQLEQDPADLFISTQPCSIPSVRYTNILYTEAGSFLSKMPNAHSIPIKPFRNEGSDDSAIKLTHGDLHRTNILVLIDWEQSGWLQEYWEDRKARWSVGCKEEWSTRYLPVVLDEYDSTCLGTTIP
ncbi:hypothetical protein BJX70DRAFT_387615 [Aspergillus crustosus]